MKVIGVGLNKTGTKTLRECLTILGLNPCARGRQAVNVKAYKSWESGDLNGILDVVSAYDSFEDWPWPFLYKEIDFHFPESKYILTTRSSSETWFNSLCRHAERTGPTEFRRRIFGFAMPHDHKQEHIQIYNSHNSSVQKYFENKPARLITLCWEQGDDWAKLCEFLEMRAPNMLFPHRNKGADSS